MRETIAKLFCLLTLLVAVALSWLFALRHNPGLPSSPAAVAAPPSAPVTATPPSLPPETALRAREVFTGSGCATCHSVAGVGNPRVPLDTVGAELSPEGIRAWTTGTGEAAGQLGDSLRRRKQRYLELPEADLDALVLWLAAQR